MKRSRFAGSTSLDLLQKRCVSGDSGLGVGVQWAERLSVCVTASSSLALLVVE